MTKPPPPPSGEPDTHEVIALVNLFNQGRYAEAELLARQMASSFPAHGFGWKCLGAILKQSGRSAEALEPMRQAVLLSPDDAAAHNNLGAVLRDLGRLDEAERSCRRALEIAPDLPDAYYNLANALRDLRRPEEAEAVYRKALALRRQHADAHNNLGIVLDELGRPGEAEACYRQALQVRPDYAEAHNNLAVVLKALGRLGEAEASCRRAVRIKPEFAEAHSNLGDILKEQGRLDEAAAACRRALQIRPEFAGAYSNLGNILRELGSIEEAEASCRRALQLDATLVEAYNNLGNVLKDAFRLDEAEAVFRQALDLKLDHVKARNNLGVVLKEQGRLDEAEASYRGALRVKADFPEAHSNLLFAMNCAASSLTADHLEEARKYGKLVARKAEARYSSWNCEPRPQRLRIGLVSGDLHNHPVGYFLEAVLAKIDPSRLELLAYPTDRKEDALTARIRRYFAAWEPLAGLNDEAAARLIHAHGIHVLLDLAGHTAKNRLPVFARKPAPVQASWLGYFATTGVAEIDYVLADQVGVPEKARKDFTEAVWHLADTRFCFSAPDVDLDVVDLPALRHGHVTFGCFQNLAKVGDGVLSAWARILQALPEARLRLQCRQLDDDHAVARLVERLGRHGIAPAGVSLHGSVAREAYLAAHGVVDLMLDTFPYPGGTTTCEALWMGVPTLTLAGGSLLARQGASLLTAAGLADWVAASEADYVDRAIAIAQDLPKLANLRAGLRRQVMASPLFDASRFARHFEAALWGMWESRSGQARS